MTKNLQFLAEPFELSSRCICHRHSCSEAKAVALNDVTLLTVVVEVWTHASHTGSCLYLLAEIRKRIKHWINCRPISVRIFRNMFPKHFIIGEPPPTVETELQSQLWPDKQEIP